MPKPIFSNVPPVILIQTGPLSNRQEVSFFELGRFRLIHLTQSSSSEWFRRADLLEVYAGDWAREVDNICPLVRSRGCKTVRHTFSVGTDIVCARGSMRDVVTLLAFISDISVQRVDPDKLGPRTFGNRQSRRR